MKCKLDTKRLCVLKARARRDEVCEGTDPAACPYHLVSGHTPAQASAARRFAADAERAQEILEGRG